MENLSMSNKTNIIVVIVDTLRAGRQRARFRGLDETRRNGLRAEVP